MRKKNITDAEKKLILRMRKAGKSYAEIGRQLELSKSTVMLWVKRGEGCKEGRVPPTFKSTGRVRKTTRTTDRFLRRKVIENPSISARELRMRHEGVLGDVSIRTIQHRLQKDLGLPA